MIKEKTGYRLKIAEAREFNKIKKICKDYEEVLWCKIIMSSNGYASYKREMIEIRTTSRPFLNDTYDCSRGGSRCVYGYWELN